MNLAFRGYKDKGFTAIAYFCVLLLGFLLLVVLIPMTGRGLSAVLFRETVEFRRMQYAIFNRGNEERLRAQVARVEEARRPIYELLDSFARGIDTESQISRVRDIFRRFNEELRLQSFAAKPDIFAISLLRHIQAPTARKSANSLTKCLRLPSRRG